MHNQDVKQSMLYVCFILTDHYISWQCTL